MAVLISDKQDKVPVTPDMERLVEQVVERALALAGAHLGPDVEVSVTFVDDEQITDLNRDHRGLAQPTDVLSFALLEGEDLPRAEGEPLALGDVVVSLERAMAQAAEYGHSFERELGFLVCHGVLHLLGYDHQDPESEARMMAKTEEILGGLGLTR